MMIITKLTDQLDTVEKLPISYTIVNFYYSCELGKSKKASNLLKFLMCDLIFIFFCRNILVIHYFLHNIYIFSLYILKVQHAKKRAFETNNNTSSKKGKKMQKLLFTDLYKKKIHITKTDHVNI